VTGIVEGFRVRAYYLRIQRAIIKSNPKILCRSEQVAMWIGHLFVSLFVIRDGRRLNNKTLAPLKFRSAARLD
jgi:hypothetical protein